MPGRLLPSLFFCREVPRMQAMPGNDGTPAKHQVTFSVGCSVRISVSIGADVHLGYPARAPALPMDAAAFAQWSCNWQNGSVILSDYVHDPSGLCDQFSSSVPAVSWMVERSGI